MGALAHYFERDGIATTHLSLVREHTELIRPPRALWVPFMLGRPFGAPNAPEFQRRVLTAALKLLEAGRGPLLEDFAEDAPSEIQGADELQEGLACPVSFGRASTSDDPLRRLLDEIAQLRPWHDISVRRGRRGGPALSGMELEQLARFAASYDGTSPLPSYDAQLSAAEALKRVCDDLKAFYVAAAAAQPGEAGLMAIEQWFWRETAAGALFLRLRDACLRSDDAGLQTLGAKMLVPRIVAG